MATGPRLISIVTCLEASAGRHYTLHDVFRSLPAVPDRIAVYLEFEAPEGFSYELDLVREGGKSTYESEQTLVLRNLSGRIEEVVELPVGLSGALPGSYTIEVRDAETSLLFGSRQVFFGEM